MEKGIMEQNVKRISKDFFYNIVASFVMTGVMQIIVYPFLAQRFSSYDYGTILTFMGIVNIVIVALGNTLNNTRLIVDSEYEKTGQKGDFNILLAISILIAIGIVVFIGYIYFNQDIITNIFLACFTGFSIFRTYLSVEFRLILNFKKILIGNVCGALGYVFGIMLLNIVHVWSIPFFMAEVFYTIYVLNNTHLYKEKWGKTTLFKATSSKFMILIITGLVGNFLMYLDRLVIYPLLGGTAVSNYTVASFFGKTLGIVMLPIGGVLLGYYAQKNFVMTQKKFWSINFMAVAFSILFVLISIVLSPIVTKVLYPTLYESSKQYLLIANLAAIINVTCSLTQTAILKFAPTWLQIIKETIYGVVYIGSGLILLEKYGLWGFCLAAILANLSKLIAIYIIGTKYIDRNVELC